MAAPKGNSYWTERLKHGRDRKFETPEELEAKICEYFDWVEANPLQEQKAFSYEGSANYADLNKMRAMTIAGLCIHIGIAQRTWGEYRKLEDFTPLITRTEEIIRQQKFEGAAAELLNPNIIARDLGLKDQQEVDLSAVQPATVFFGVLDASKPEVAKEDSE